MLHIASPEKPIDRLAAKLRLAEAPTLALMSALVGVLPRGRSSDASRIEALIGAGAWVDLALVLARQELPQWSMRQLCFEDGHWHCSLSRHPLLPRELDDTATASHESLPLAILSAVVEGLHVPDAACDRPVRTVPATDRPGGDFACCDNFV